ncbi:methyl-CpG-binding domain-containing protein 2-like [Sesamum indicum]|uniref:Methyl-CpG-binding domain-containing protein 2-like n=1 Tax=Sesamum indicum TaxID=4182 RepID=A0A8M8USE0_SESIN|nr:methyl-CpG-binding domain-containing protein 2-like [Sesamum indicum]
MEQEQAIGAKTVWESVKLYAVKCAKCSKWRLIPTKEKYEEIRERIVERSFLCDTARAWRPNVSCNDESDVKLDDSFLWAMDKPRIPQTPPGWQRILRIRAEGGTKFADVYINEHPHLCEGVNISQFSFQPPVPLDEKYIAKRARCTTHVTSSTPAAGAYHALQTQNDSSGVPERATTEAKATAQS